MKLSFEHYTCKITLLSIFTQIYYNFTGIRYVSNAANFEPTEIKTYQNVYGGLINEKYACSGRGVPQNHTKACNGVLKSMKLSIHAF